MIQRRKLLGAVLACPLLAVGCATPPPERPRLDLRFVTRVPLTLAVGGVRVESGYVPPMAAPNVDHEFPVPPIRALRAWAGDRLRAIGGTDRAVLVIEDAGARRRALPTDRGVTGLFKQEQSDRWEARVAARLEIRDARGGVLAQAGATVTRAVTTPEDITLNERDLVWYDLTGAMMADFDDVMERNIRRHMAPWLR